jgi:UDP-glucuronate decarboxylase
LFNIHQTLNKDIHSQAKTMKRILITGGAGFLGSHLCDKLLEQGHDIICVDNFFTGSKNNILHLLPHPCFELIRHDIINPIYLEIDEIYNLACPASPVHYQFNPIKTIKTSVMGAINTLGLAKRVKAKILQASTSEVYGDPEIHPQTEAYWGRVNPIGIRSCYDEGKRAAECLMMDYHRQNQVNVKIVRIFNTYGPRMAVNDGRVVSNFIVQALTHQDITVYGDGSQTRSFCYVNDMIDGMIRMMATPDDFLGPVNLGNPREFTILELAERLIRMTGSRAKIIFKPLPQDDPAQRKPDIRLARETFGWQPKIPLEEGIEKTIAYFRKVL